MADYPLLVLSDAADEYGQFHTTQPSGTIRAAVFLNDQRNIDSPVYAQATYIGLTWRTDITDRHLIQTDDGIKKVLQVLPGRMTRLLLADWGTSE